MITLEQLLDSRDRRVQHQSELLSAFPGCSLICLTVQLPGPVKRSPDSLVIGGAGLAALMGVFGSVLRHAQVRDLETGYEAYLLVPLPALEVKKRCCKIEDEHPLGRLMDIDVIAEISPRACFTPPICNWRGPRSLGRDDISVVIPSGAKEPPISRSDIGLSPRRCLLCSREARYCMRAHTHTTEELLAKIAKMVEEYTKS
ncbi:MAG: citrate lyase holo-[acyl-carrier protein] synthase [Bacteroidales bacterium]|nr:citrate lyase holo-[acyl-carrier protein] synthase [Bacteroidales bacterium]